MSKRKSLTLRFEDLFESFESDALEFIELEENKSLDKLPKLQERQRVASSCLEKGFALLNYEEAEQPWGRRPWLGLTPEHDYPPSYLIRHGILDELLCNAIEVRDYKKGLSICNQILEDKTIPDFLFESTVNRKFDCLFGLNAIEDLGSLYESVKNHSFGADKNGKKFYYCCARLWYLYSDPLKAYQNACKVIDIYDGTHFLNHETYWCKLIKSVCGPPPSTLNNLDKILDEWTDVWNIASCVDTPIEQTAIDFLNWALNILKLHPNHDRLLGMIKNSVEGLKGSNGYTDIINRIERMEFLSKNPETDKMEIFRVVDASRIGNEGRYANHSDDPNAALILGEHGGYKSMNLIAIYPIDINEEITIHYGAEYWRHVNLSETSEDISPDSLLYFDGLLYIPDDSPIDPILHYKLVAPNNFIQRNPDLSIQKCPTNHPCYPGYRLIANKKYNTGDKICVYGGILKSMPGQADRLSCNRYLLHLGKTNIYGSFGFTIKEIGKDKKPVYHSVQRNLPILANIQNSQADGLRNFQINRTPLNNILIEGLDETASKSLLAMLRDEKKQKFVNQKLRDIEQKIVQATKNNQDFRQVETDERKKLKQDILNENYTSGGIARHVSSFLLRLS
jgi:SET domain